MGRHSAPWAAACSRNAVVDVEVTPRAPRSGELSTSQAKRSPSRSPNPGGASGAGPPQEPAGAEALRLAAQVLFGEVAIRSQVPVAGLGRANPCPRPVRRGPSALVSPHAEHITSVAAAWSRLRRSTRSASLRARGAPRAQRWAGPLEPRARHIQPLYLSPSRSPLPGSRSRPQRPRLQPLLGQQGEHAAQPGGERLPAQPFTVCLVVTEQWPENPQQAHVSVVVCGGPAVEALDLSPGLGVVALASRLTARRSPWCRPSARRAW